MSLQAREEDNKNEKKDDRFHTIVRCRHQYLITLLRNPRSEDEFGRYLDAIQEIFDRKQECALLYDVRQLTWVKPKLIKIQRAFMKRTQELSEEYVTVAAVVVSNKFMKTVSQALVATMSVRNPIKVFDDMNCAKQYLRRFEDQFA